MGKRSSSSGSNDVKLGRVPVSVSTLQRELWQTTSTSPFTSTRLGSSSRLVLKDPVGGLRRKERYLKISVPHSHQKHRIPPATGKTVSPTADFGGTSLKKRDHRAAGPLTETLAPRSALADLNNEEFMPEVIFIVRSVTLSPPIFTPPLIVFAVAFRRRQQTSFLQKLAESGIRPPSSHHGDFRCLFRHFTGLEATVELASPQPRQPQPRYGSGACDFVSEPLFRVTRIATPGSGTHP